MLIYFAISVQGHQIAVMIYISNKSQTKLNYLK